MAFVKIVKNKAYCMRMQVKPKRRRQGKTDYFARKRLVCQDKNKYTSKKYRLVVRRTSTRILCQVIYATMKGDMIFCAADSNELKGFGLTAGLTNYSSAYCTGLLIARRLLKKVSLDGDYKGQESPDGQYFSVGRTEDGESVMEGEKRPFKALLDVGIQRTTTGSRIFGAMKGACDGGLNVPHSTKRFPGYIRAKLETITNKRGKAEKTEKSDATFDAKVHRDRIMGAHVTGYMNQLKKENPDKFKRQFSQWESCLSKMNVKTCEDAYKKVHKAIRANPDRQKNKGNANPVKKVVTPGYARVYQDSKGNKWLRHFRMTNAMRHDRVQEKFRAALADQK